MVHEVKGDLLMADVDYICHQVNCRGVMGSGIARSIKDKWPHVFTEYRYWWSNNDFDILGQIDIASTATEVGKYVINMAAQDGYGYDGRRYTSYDAFWMCLGEILQKVPKGSKLGFPKNIGCCRGGANWNVIKSMITEVLGKDYEVYIYELEAK